MLSVLVNPFLGVYVFLAILLDLKLLLFQCL